MWRATSIRCTSMRLPRLSIERPYLKASYCDVTDAGSFPRLETGFDTVVCLNVIEHLESDRHALSNMRSVLAEGGTAVILVPHNQWNFGTLDVVLGHCRRYSKESLRQAAENAGFVVKDIFLVHRNRYASLLPQWQSPCLGKLFVFLYLDARTSCHLAFSAGSIGCGHSPASADRGVRTERCRRGRYRHSAAAYREIERQG